MTPRPFTPLTLFLVFALAGCSSLEYEGAKSGPLGGAKRVVLVQPFENATNNSAAGVALTQMTASALSANGVQWVMAGSGEDSGKLTYSYVLQGRVHEYEYKTDLNGDPAVGASASIQSAKTGEVLWQGSASATGGGLSSVSMAGQRVADELVRNMLGN